MRKISLVLIFGWLAGNVYAQETVPVGKLQEYLNSRGKEESWDNVKTLYVESKVWLNLNINGITSKNILANVSPSTHRKYIQYPNKQKIEIFSDGKWKADFYLVDGTSLMVLPMGRNPYVSRRDIDKFPQQELLNCWTDKNDINKEVYMDKEYFIITCSGTKFLINPDTFLVDYVSSVKQPEIVTELLDYRKVDGVLIPFKKQTTKKGILFCRTEIINITLNPEFDENALFKVPE